MLRHWAIALFLVSPVLGCFLNSCPYRRYGRNVQCATCGDNGEGICVGEGQCCSSTRCFDTPECVTNAVCPPRFCKVLQASGYCIAPMFCCTNALCQRSMQCM